MYLCAPETFRFALMFCDLFTTIVPGSPSLGSKYASGGEMIFALYWYASTPPMNVRSSVWRCELYAENVVFTLPM